MPQTLKIAVCICQEVTFGDFMMPMELFGTLNLAGNPFFGQSLGPDVPYRVKVEYLAPTMDLVFGFFEGLPGIKPTRTYGDAIEKDEKYDIIWVPAGPITDMITFQDRTPKEEIEFVKKKAPEAKWIVSACAGSAILAYAGILDGKRATTNKALYKMITRVYSRDGKITWVPKARWVVDGNVWTSSGITAGTDMALAFLKELVGEKITQAISNMSEIAHPGSADDDPFAAINGLI